MSASESASPGGHPSTTAPRAGPWLSPQGGKRSARPNVFLLMAKSLVGAAIVLNVVICPLSSVSGVSDRTFSYRSSICHRPSHGHPILPFLATARLRGPRSGGQDFLSLFFRRICHPFRSILLSMGDKSG